MIFYLSSIMKYQLEKAGGPQNFVRSGWTRNKRFVLSNDLSFGPMDKINKGFLLD